MPFSELITVAWRIEKTDGLKRINVLSLELGMESVGPNLKAEKLGYSGRRKYRMDSDEESNKCPANKELTIVIFVMVVGT